MRINFELTKKEIFKYYNIACGMILKKGISKKTEINAQSFIERKIAVYLICFLFIPLIAFFDSFITLDWLTNLFALIMIILFFINTISILFFLFAWSRYTKKYSSGEIKINEMGISGQFDSGSIIEKEWNSIKHVIFHEDIILFYTNQKEVIFLPHTIENAKKIREILIEKQKSSIIKTAFVSRGFLHYFQYLGKYILVFIILFGIAIFWDIYNISLIDDEIWKINNSGYQNIDGYIFSYQKFGIVEKTLKEYFKEFYKNKEIYYENAAVSIFSQITVDLLKNNPKELDNILNSLSEQEILATNSILNIIDLLNEDKVMERIKEKRLGENYENTFKDYALTEEDSIHTENWKNEMNQNHEKMKYVKRALEILTKEKKCWYVEDDTFYMCDDYLEEYNKLYNLILEQKKEEEQTI